MNNPTVLFIDDELSRRDKFQTTFGEDAIITFVDNPRDAIQHLRCHRYDKIFLDHDLGFEPMTGNDIAACLFQSINTRVKIFVHSANPNGTENICRTLDDLNMEYEACCIFAQDFWGRARRYIEA